MTTLKSRQSQGQGSEALSCKVRLQRPEFVLDVDEVFSTQGITALFGPSGSGKSSLLRTIAGLEKGACGLVRMADTTWQDDQRRQFVKTQQRQIGLVFQQANLFPHLNVAGNLRYGLRRSRMSQQVIAWDDVVRWLDLSPLLARRVSSLSGGEQQRVAIGRALLSQPRLLLLDEPLSGVDLARRDEIMPFLERLHRSLSIPMILVTHQLEEVARLADWVLAMKDGKVVRRGPVHEMLGYLSSTGQEPFSLLPGVIEVVDDRDHLTGVQTALGMIWLPGCRGEVGDSIRLLLHASHISLSLQRVEQVSILNQIEVRVLSLEARGADQLVTLDAQGVHLYAQLSHRAVRQMALKAEVRLFAMVKSVSVLSAQSGHYNF